METEVRPFEKNYAKCIEVSKRVRWEMDRDIFRGRNSELDKKFLPDGITLMERFDFLDPSEKRLLSQIQREKAVEELIELIVDFDDILRLQGGSDIDYFLANTPRSFDQEAVGRLKDGTLRAYVTSTFFGGAASPLSGHARRADHSEPAGTPEPGPRRSAVIGGH